MESREGLSPRLTVASRKDDAVPSCILLAILDPTKVSSSEKASDKSLKPISRKRSDGWRAMDK